MTKTVIVALGNKTGTGSDAVEIDMAGMSIGRGNVLVLRAGAMGQTVVLSNVGTSRAQIDGTIRAEGIAGAYPPRIHLHDEHGITIPATGRVSGTSGLVVDALGASFNTGQPVVNEGVVDGGADLAIMGSGITGGGRFQGDAVLLSTFGNANNPVNGAHYLANGINVGPSAYSTATVRLAINEYGRLPQTFNVLVHGDAVLQIPIRWSSEYQGLPPNNDTYFGTTVFDAPYGGGQLLVQATGSLTLAGGSDNLLVYPGGIVLRAGRRIDISDVWVDNAWTARGRTFQGMFFEAPRILSSRPSGTGFIRVLTNTNNWINFSTHPTASVSVGQLTAQGATFEASFTAPHINPYASMIETAASGGCWICEVDTVPVNMQ